MPISDLDRLSRLDFHTYMSLALNNGTLDPATVINVGQPSFVVELGRLMRRTPLATLRDAMRYTAVLSFAGDLPEEFGKEYFRFFGTTLSGTPKQPERWKRCQAKAVAWMVRGRPQHARRELLR
jgi:predicted metalloendopeptidase